MFRSVLESEQSLTVAYIVLIVVQEPANHILYCKSFHRLIFKQKKNGICVIKRVCKYCTTELLLLINALIVPPLPGNTHTRQHARTPHTQNSIHVCETQWTSSSSRCGHQESQAKSQDRKLVKYLCHPSYITRRGLNDTNGDFTISCTP